MTPIDYSATLAQLRAEQERVNAILECGDRLSGLGVALPIGEALHGKLEPLADAINALERLLDDGKPRRGRPAGSKNRKAAEPLTERDAPGEVAL